MKVVILGFGISGKAAADYFTKKGADLVCVDRHPQGEKVIAETTPIDLSGVDLVVKSPGLLPTHPWVEAAKEKGIPVMGEVDVALKELIARKKTLFAITGTNGKTTTTLLTAHILNKGGRKAIAVGNVGIPLISQLDSAAEIFVIELSSFQLESLISGPLFEGGVILNITPNHLDHHLCFETYLHAKFQMQHALKKNAPLIVQQALLDAYRGKIRPDTKTIVFDSLKKKVETILSLRYTGGRSPFFSHDLENFCAALALTSLAGISIEAFCETVRTFQKPPHRLEVVRQWKGITYINDSKATNVDAVKKALSAMETKVILIAGGIDKGGSFREWLSLIREKVVMVLAIGKAANKIQQEVKEIVPVEMVYTLEEGVRWANKLAKPGETVLLSPGCSSFDQFRDYQHRGDAFKQLVEGMS